MTIAGYGVLVGTVKDTKPAKPKSPHYEIQLGAGGESFRIALNVASDEAPHDVLYLVDQDFKHALLGKLAPLGAGFTAIESVPGGLALDYVRGELFDTSHLRPLPATAGTDNDMNKVVGATIDRARKEAGARVFAFGQWFPPPTKPEARDKIFGFSPEQGIHDLHMNQGNRKAPHDRDNGVWQDGGMLVHFPSADRWVATFIAFQSQAFQTDEHGDAAGTQASRDPRVGEHKRRHRKQPMAPLGFSLEPHPVHTAPPRPPGAPPPAEAGERFVATEIPPPATRTLRAYAFDPSRGRVLDNAMTLAVPYHELAPGPVETEPELASRLAVIDYDATSGVYYKPVNLDDHRILLGNGLWPSESDARFHQQMVYAVARETISHFETALGRKIHWRRAARGDAEQGPGWRDGDILTLGLFPHAMREANAFYSPSAHGILFGYFAADPTNTERALPGQPVFTCLSHDVIVHEMTHAVIDGHRGFFLEQTNRDVAAFHEGFADLAALFRHFTHREVLLDTIQRTGGRLYSYQLRSDASSDAGATPAKLDPGKSHAQIAAQIAQSNPLIELAQQFGDATGLRGALRSALGTPPTPADYRTVTEPHHRGSILVAAVFDAFFSIYVKRTSDLFAIFRAGGGSADPVDLPGPLARMLCDVATTTAEQFFAICARAIDYCPAVDLTFGEFLRAMITAEVDRDPDDRDGIREALMQAFRLRGILPDGARFFSEDALCWSRGDDLGLPLLPGLHFGDPNGLSRADRARIAPVLRAYLDDRTVRARLGFAPDLPVDLTSFHPVFRTLDGSLRRDMVVEAVQTRQVTFDHDAGSSYPFRAGATLMIAPERTRGGGDSARVRWAVTKPMHDQHNHEAHERHRRQQAYLIDRGLSGLLTPSALTIDFALVHGGI